MRVRGSLVRADRHYNPSKKPQGAVRGTGMHTYFLATRSVWTGNTAGNPDCLVLPYIAHLEPSMGHQFVQAAEGRLDNFGIATFASKKQWLKDCNCKAPTVAAAILVGS